MDNRNIFSNLTNYPTQLSKLNYFVVSQTKRHERFLSQKFVIPNFVIWVRRDRYRHDRGLIKYVRKCFICKRLNNVKPKSLECICSELTLSKRKWIYYSISSSSKDLKVSFHEINYSLSEDDVNSKISRDERL